ncbi:phage-related lysozyme (muraminidase) [Caulobacter sp. AP07]|uniref:lysozyme n=1 Tax=Caulobacter sp. AP07 TaxID=1144304 RepID=UPI0002722022|nr:lysozyme [Caulobacter sp. AP07]EJL33233.1 phage-related lysozyme (muraminidase) [Caulobacter sp. AP07]
MTPSPKIITFIQGYEKCRLKAYMPTPNDRPTLGWGSTGPDIRMGMKWTQVQADERFARDLARFGGQVSALLGSAPTTQDQYDALVSFAYNVGYGDGGLKTSTLLRMHKAGDYADAALQFARWDKQAGKSLAGLTKRRAAEAAIYRGGA